MIILLKTSFIYTILYKTLLFSRVFSYYNLIWFPSILLLDSCLFLIYLYFLNNNNIYLKYSINSTLSIYCLLLVYRSSQFFNNLLVSFFAFLVLFSAIYASTYKPTSHSKRRKNTVGESNRPKPVIKIPSARSLIGMAIDHSPKTPTTPVSPVRARKLSLKENIKEDKRFFIINLVSCILV